MRIAIDIRADLAHGGDPDWVALQEVISGQAETANILGGLVVTADNAEKIAEKIEENLVQVWKDWLNAAAEKCGAEVLFTRDPQEAAEWVRTPGEDELAWEDSDELAYDRHTLHANVWAEAMRYRRALGTWG